MCQTKYCSSCKETKTTDLFTKVKDDFYHICKSCRRDRYYKSKGETTPPQKPKSKDETKQICTKCGIEKDLSEYSSGHKKNGTTSRCKKCSSEDSKSKVVTEYHNYINNEKMCNLCGTLKSTTEFHKDKRAFDGLQSKCNSCMKNYTKDNKNIVSVEEKVCYSCNILKKSCEFISDKTKKDGLCHLCKTCYSNKRKNNRLDPLKKLKDTLRNRIRDSFIKSCGGKFTKSKSTLSIIGCDFKFFHRHIKKQFENWMNEDNHGFCEESEYNCKYHLDHIIPVSYAKTEEELFLLNHWSNFQPLCGKKNLEKLSTVYPCTNLELRITFWEDHYEYV
jgi:hypothetical protein